MIAAVRPFQGGGISRRDSLQVADADRRIDFLAPAGLLARASAHPTEAAREDVVFAIELKAVGVPAVRDEGDVSGDIGVGRAGRHAGDVVGKPLRVACIDRIALAGPFGVRRKERGVDECEQAKPARIVDIDIEALANHGIAGQFVGGEIDFRGVHRAEPVGRRAAGWARIRRSDSVMDPATYIATKHDCAVLPSEARVSVNAQPRSSAAAHLPVYPPAGAQSGTHSSS
jgi:hypothetical protein